MCNLFFRFVYKEVNTTGVELYDIKKGVQVFIRDFGEASTKAFMVVTRLISQILA